MRQEKIAGPLPAPAPERGAASRARRALDLLARRYRQYRQEPPEGAVVAIDVERWREWSAS